MSVIGDLVTWRSDEWIDGNLMKAKKIQKVIDRIRIRRDRYRKNLQERFRYEFPPY